MLTNYTYVLKSANLLINDALINIYYSLLYLVDQAAAFRGSKSSLYCNYIFHIDRQLERLCYRCIYFSYFSICLKFRQNTL